VETKSLAERGERGLEERCRNMLANQHSKSDELQDWLRFIRGESHILRERPALLFQQARINPIPPRQLPLAAATLRSSSDRGSADSIIPLAEGAADSRD
jgi:hypothetical protein